MNILGIAVTLLILIVIIILLVLLIVNLNKKNKATKKIDNIIRENSSYIAKNARIKVNSFDWSVVRRQWLKLLQ